eukprot:XP_001692349.1 predicted protein [Chlamydomonas reinhardtii]
MAQDWSLKGAGAANLVYAYCGEDERLRGHVLRVRKGTAHAASEVDIALWEGVLVHKPGDAAGRELSYVADVMAPLLGRQYVFPGAAALSARGWAGVGPAVCLEDGLPLSYYNPLDLFSGQPDRMAAALARLLEAPSDGVQLYGGTGTAGGGSDGIESAPPAPADAGAEAGATPVTATVAFVDLDIKAAGKLPKHLALERQLEDTARSEAGGRLLRRLGELAGLLPEP